LCGTHGEHALFFSDRHRHYRHCATCSLVFVPKNQHLSLQHEKAIYDLHDNRPDDPGYCHFLSRLATPLCARLQPDSICLDYGCGPAPVLAQLIAARGHQVAIYDPFYAADSAVLDQRYDAVTCSEVAEHFRCPDREFARLFALLKPHGQLALMTKLVIDQTAFSRWHYKNDPTHISFFSSTTLHWLAEHYRCRLDLIGADVAIFRREA
jgi:Methyltransferase domain